jgi:thymidylate kinase
MKPCAKMIAIEGPDCVGKETQSKLLFEHLSSCGYKVARVEVPVNDGITHKLIYWMLKNKLAKNLPSVFQFVQALNKIGFFLFKLKKLLRENDYLILDRWILSAYVYGTVTNVPRLLNNLFYFFVRDVNAYVVLVGQPFNRTGLDDYEKDTKLQKDVRMQYTLSCMQKPYNTRAKFFLISSGHSIESVAVKVKEAVQNV